MLKAEIRSIIATLATTLRLCWSSADRSVKVALAIGLSFVLLSSALTALAPVALSHLVDSLDPKATRTIGAMVAATLAAYVAAVSLSRLFTELRTNIYGRAQQRLNRVVSDRVYSHLVQLPIRYHHEHNAGMLSQDVANGLTGIRLISLHIGNTVVPFIVEALLVVIVILHLDSQFLTALFILTSFGYIAIYTRGSYAMLGPARGISAASASAAQAVNEGIVNYETVKSFQAESLVKQRFRHWLREADSFWGQLFRRRNAVSLATNIVFFGSLATALAWSANQVDANALSLGNFVLVNAYMIRLSTPLELLGMAFRDLTEGSAHVQRLLRILEVQPESSAGMPTTVMAQNAAIEFRDVSFSYVEGRPILKNVSFSVEPGTTVAIVGRSGSGKSTIAKLLLRLYEPNSGTILLDGRNASDLSLSGLRSCISTVPQEAILFNDSIANNITLGRDFDWEQVQAAAATAGIASTVTGWPDGFSTLVGERGLKLSGGERQRIAIARAVVQKPRLFIFDEATSSLDSRTEQAILNQLAQLAERTTTLIIAHRLATVRNADRILILEDGQLVEQGTHDDLIAHDGHYAALWRAQHADSAAPPRSTATGGPLPPAGGGTRH